MFGLLDEELLQNENDNIMQKCNYDTQLYL